MPWDETTRMSQRLRFISAFESCQFTMTQLCERYGISRKTGYKWANRFAQEGVGAWRTVLMWRRASRTR